MATIRCDVCRERVAGVVNGKLLLKSAIAFKLRAGRLVCETTCPAPSCRADVTLPMTLTDDALVKSLGATASPTPVRLVLSLPAPSQRR